jgi:hypothetical protein
VIGRKVASEEDNKAGELDKTEEVLGVVLPADEDAALPFDPSEEAKAVLWILNTGAEWHMLRKAIRTTKLCTGAFKLGVATRLCAGY